MTYLYRYLRHSDDIAKQPYSRQAQAASIERFREFASRSDEAIAKALDAGEFWDADTSGGMEIIKRPAGGLMMGRVAKGDIIVAAAWDRMFRDSRDFENTLHYLDKVGVRLICLDMQVDTATAMGRFAARIIVAKGELERTQTSERIKDRLAVIKHTKGVSIAYGCPTGWKHVRRAHAKTRKDGQPYATIVPDLKAREECELIVKLREGQKMSCSQIAKLFMRNGRTNSKGTLYWDHETIRERYKAAKAGYPAPYDYVDGQNRDQLMIAVQQ